MTAGFATTTHIDAPLLQNVIPTTAPRTPRARRALRRNRLALLHRHGFAPDQEHGVRELGAMYDLADPAQLERTVFVSTLRSAGATLMTVGRWDQGFFDLVQLVLHDDLPTSRVEELVGFVAGAERVLAMCKQDLRILDETVASVDAELAASLLQCPLLPVARDRQDLLRAESGVLGLEREDLIDDREIRAVFREALAQDPMALRRMLDAGRMDVLTGHALYQERLLR